MNSKVWYYKGNTYRILGKVRMKDPKSGEWLDGLKYTRITGVDDGGREYVREEMDFYRKFIPSYLTIGDDVVLMSHGKCLGVTQVANIMESGEFVELEKSLGNSPKIIRRATKENGFIPNVNANYDCYYYNETTCKMLGIEFK